MNTKTILMAMTCLCAFNSLQGNVQVAGGNTLEIVDADGQRKFYPLQHVRSYKTLADQN